MWNRALLFRLRVALLLVTAACADLSPDAAPTGDSPGPASRLAFVVQPADGGVGVTLSPAIQVSGRDLFDNPSPLSAPVSLSLNPAPGMLSGTVTRTPVAGVAVFSDLRVGVASASYTITAASAGLTPVTSGPFAVCSACWVNTRAYLPGSTTHLGLGALNGVLYAVGGNRGTHVLSYHPSENSWAQKAPGPYAGDRVQVVALDGTLFAYNGASGLAAYDAMSDAWTNKASAPSNGQARSATVVNGVLYVFGGASGNWGQFYVAVDAYDPASNSWSSRAPTSVPRAYAGVGVINGIAYVFGGMRGGAVADVEAYNPATNMWTTRAPMPLPTSAVGAAVLRDTLYSIGGNDGGYVSSGAGRRTVLAYDPVTDRWSDKPALLYSRDHLAAAVLDGRIYAVGGGDVPTEVFVP